MFVVVVHHKKSKLNKRKCFIFFERFILQRRDAEAKRVRQIEEDAKQKAKELEERRRRNLVKRQKRNDGIFFLLLNLFLIEKCDVSFGFF